MNMKKSAGFTLVEVMVAVAILVIVSIIGFAIFRGLEGRVSSSKAQSDVKAMAAALELKYNQNDKYQPFGSVDFASGSIPTPKTGNSYVALAATDLLGVHLGFRVCANLVDVTECSVPSPDCYCIDSVQSAYDAALTSTTFYESPGGSSPAPSASPSSSPISSSSPASSPSPSPSPSSSPAAPSCSFTGPTALTVGTPGSYDATVIGVVDTYFWQTIVGPASGIYSPSVLVEDVGWSSNTAGSYTLQLTVTGPGGSGACQNTTPIQVDPAPAPSPSPSPSPSPPPDADGDGVTDASDCAPADSTRWQNLTCFADADNDTYTVGGGVSVCKGLSCTSPAGHLAAASTTLDCYDVSGGATATCDAATHTLSYCAHPGQTTYFVPNRGDGSWDYNCNSTNDKRWTAVSSVGASCTTSTTGISGWLGGSAPACGAAAGTFRRCIAYNVAACGGTACGANDTCAANCSALPAVSWAGTDVARTQTCR